MSGFYLPSENEFDTDTDDFVPPALSKERRYKHFDLPLREAERAQDTDFEVYTKPHRFLPLLGYTDVTRRFIRNDEGKREVTVKKRPIRFASHGDAAYLEAYASHLESFYEKALANDGISQSVLAYRRGGGTNIHHAKSLFDEIKRRGDCSVYALDISGFFDNLDHLHLRNELTALLNVDWLEGHHGDVWKNITTYSWVEIADLDRVLGTKRNRQGRICSTDDFKNHVRGRKGGLVQKHQDTFGIPQGTPVSGLYANIYLRSFDREMVALCSTHGASYRRYSDDIAIVLPLGAKKKHVVAVVEKLLANFSLSLSVAKTDTADFKDGRLVSSEPIQYLGFTFDGTKILIRPSSLDAYRKKMRTGIHAKLVAAKTKGISSVEVFKRESLSRYTHLGKRRNFLRYAYKAAEIMQAPEIKRQVSPHMTWFKRTWNREIVTVFGGTVA